MADPRVPPPDQTEKTVLMPTPGGRRRGGAAAGVATPAALTDERIDTGRDGDLSALGGAGSNPFLRSATPLLALISHMRTARGHHDVPALRRQMMAALRQLDAELRRTGVEPEDVRKAQYALCALIDETVLSTPWGFQSAWGTEPLQITLFGKGIGGEYFYDILRDALRYPSGNIDLLELYHVCLSLGYKGRYGREREGSTALDQLRAEVYQAILRERGEPANDLSPRWRGVADRRPRIARYVAWWAVPIVVLALLTGAYAGLSFDLNRESDQVYARISELPTPTPLPPPEPVETVVVPPEEPEVVETTWLDAARLSLRPEIEQELIAVREVDGGGRIILFNRGLFASGRADVGEPFKPVIAKIGAVLKQDDPPGPYVVSGHTDNVPIRTLRFPSNYHLSEARAQAVAALLAEYGADPLKLQPEGRADREPIESNATAAGQALNRRVEIDVPIAAGAAGAAGTGITIE